MTPLLLVALGELYSERAGLTNIGLDGIMSIGTIAGFLGGCLTGSPWMGLLLGALCGVALNMIYAFCTITLRAGRERLEVGLQATPRARERAARELRERLGQGHPAGTRAA